jgi:quercetin dioxygenase-like cupin family protein
MTAYRALASLETLPIWTGVLARMVEGRTMTFAVVELEPGASAIVHQHANEQIGLVLRGTLAFDIAGETRELVPGDTYVVPGDTPHEATAGPEGAVVVDVFSPPRTDWRHVEPQPPSPPRWP